MKTKPWIVFVAGIVLLTSVTALHAQERRRWGIGTFLSYNLPVLSLSDRFSPASKYGMNWQYMINPRLYMEIEYHRSTFTDGKLEETPFTWAVTGEEVVSPNAVSEMKFNSLAMNLLIFYPKEPRFEASDFSYYLEVGAGFYDYRAENRNFVYPGQTQEPLDVSMVLQPQVDTRTALTVNAGVGVQAFVFNNVAIDLRARHNLVMGELRPMWDWGLRKKTIPIQMFDVGAGLKFYFKK